jgi:TPR repeat protein
MRRAKYNYRLSLAWLSLVVIGIFASEVYAQYSPPVSKDYKKFFVHYVDKRSILDKVFNYIGLENQDIGRSFALIAGVSHYPNMPLTDRELRPAAEDIKKLQEYLNTYEFFDEIVVLKDGAVTTENLEFFLQTYFPSRLRKFPKSRFLFAYSGHGMNEGSSGYLLKNSARSLTDKDNSINLGVVRVFVDEVVRSGHHVLVLLNSCYSGAFLRRSFGAPKRLITRDPGAHAITAGGTGEQAWHIPSVGKGSIFFEKVFAGLDGHADSSGDGLISVYELFPYLKQEVQIFTDQNQNPQIGDLSKDQSKGEFFFLNRDRQVTKGVLPVWQPERATPLGIKADEAIIKGKEYYRAAKYRTALPFFQESAKYGSGEAMTFLGWIYYNNGLGVIRDYAEAVRWYRKAADAGNAQAMHNLGYMYHRGQGVTQDYAEAAYWYRKAADAGNSDGMTNLGWIYKDGLGMTQDYAKAAYWYRKAADAGNAQAMYNLGHMYRDGLGVTQDYAKAAYWYRKAADAGNEWGMGHLGVMYRDGRGVTQDYAKAAYWYRKAADAGNEYAMMNLGWMYDNGKGMTQDYAKAAYWYRKAADAGNEYAIKRLKDLGEQP